MRDVLDVSTFTLRLIETLVLLQIAALIFGIVLYKDTHEFFPYTKSA